MDPKYPLMDLDEAIRIAVQLRSDEGVVALSGGVDSALVARLAGRECVVVGIAGSHDLLHARQVAEEFGLILHQHHNRSGINRRSPGPGSGSHSQDRSGECIHCHNTIFCLPMGRAAWRDAHPGRAGGR